MRLDVTLEELGDEVARSVACVTRQDLGFVEKTQLTLGLQNLVEHLQCRIPFGGPPQTEPRPDQPEP